jgi:hypothetical protein
MRQQRPGSDINYWDFKKCMEFHVIPRPGIGYGLSPDESYAVELIEPRHGTFSVEAVTAR